MNDSSPETARLIEWLATHPRLVVLTGAGLSAASGIPTYRDHNGQWQHSKPISHSEFIQSHDARQRYWARSMVGWPLMRDARPNCAHLALAQLESLDRVHLLITQNVDRLHQRAGSQRVVDLHGRLDRVICRDCRASYPRESIQHDLQHSNNPIPLPAASARPDGDSDLSHDQVASMIFPDCKACNGMLMPDVVFFGGSVPAERVQQCRRAIEEADALLVIGSSLTVYSGFRFCRQAEKLRKPIGIINPGQTRADPLAQLRLSTDCGPLLTGLLAALPRARQVAARALSNLTTEP